MIKNSIYRNRKPAAIVDPTQHTGAAFSFLVMLLSLIAVLIYYTPHTVLTDAQPTVVSQVYQLPDLIPPAHAETTLPVLPEVSPPVAPQPVMAKKKGRSVHTVRVTHKTTGLHISKADMWHIMCDGNMPLPSCSVLKPPTKIAGITIQT